VISSFLPMKGVGCNGRLLDPDCCISNDSCHTTKGL
jgi:hypothetical protein